jgi:uncharacterized membrane protein
MVQWWKNRYNNSNSTSARRIRTIINMGLRSCSIACWYSAVHAVKVVGVFVLVLMVVLCGKVLCNAISAVRECVALVYSTLYLFLCEQQR